MIAHFGYDDLTFTHLSARCSDGVSFFIQPFGKLFTEVTASSLIKVSFEGKVIEGTGSTLEYHGHHTLHIPSYPGRLILLFLSSFSKAKKRIIIRLVTCSIPLYIKHGTI